MNNRKNAPQSPNGKNPALGTYQPKKIGICHRLAIVRGISETEAIALFHALADRFHWNHWLVGIATNKECGKWVTRLQK